MSGQRTIVVGDVHGCHEELATLINEIKPGADDRVFFIGDLINKGPSSRKSYALFKDLGARAILGNHELNLKQRWSMGDTRRGIVRRMRKEFGTDFKPFIQDLMHWPLWIEEDDFLLVHAGLMPGRALTEHSAEVLCNIRTWDGKGEDLQHPDNPPWFECYEGEKLVVFGHWAARGAVVKHNVIGLDTGCVYGGKLTALILPERELVQVPARETYCPIR